MITAYRSRKLRCRCGMVARALRMGLEDAVLGSGCANVLGCNWTMRYTVHVNGGSDAESVVVLRAAMCK